jgi:hypothetical protein
MLKTNASMKLEDSNQQVQIAKGIGIRVGLTEAWPWVGDLFEHTSKCAMLIEMVQLCERKFRYEGDF